MGALGDSPGTSTVPVWQRLAGLAIAVAVAALLGTQLAGGWVLLLLAGGFCWPELIRVAESLLDWQSITKDGIERRKNREVRDQALQGQEALGQDRRVELPQDDDKLDA